MKHLFIINPVAGKKPDVTALSALITDICTRRELEYEIYVTIAPMDAAAKVRSAAQLDSRPLRVYACGGDGTLNEVVCGAVGHKNVSVTHYPIGSGNDFIRAFGEHDRALFKNLENLVLGNPLPLDIITCNGHSSINICSVGIDARVARDVHSFGKALHLGGRPAYNLSLLINLIKGINTQLTIRINGQEFKGGFALVAACNGKYYGSGFNPVPEAEPDDGLLDFLLVKEMSLFKAADLVGKYAHGRYKEIPEYISYYSGTELEIESDTPFCINIDGESDEAKKVTFRLLKSGVSFVFPMQSEFYNSRIKKTALK